MSSTTKRWMKAELQALLEQRECYQLAEATARDVAQARRRTTRLRAIDEEILGRREALAALEPVVRKTVLGSTTRTRHPTLVSPTIGATLALMQTRPAVTTSLLKVVGGSFALGFVATALLLVVASPQRPVPQASRVQTPKPVQPPQAHAPRRPLDTVVHAGAAEPARPRRR